MGVCKMHTPVLWSSTGVQCLVCMWCRNGSKLAGAYSEAETRKATIKLLR